MSKNNVAIILLLFSLGIVIISMWFMLHKQPEKTDYLPTATNDSMFAVIGLQSSSEAKRSIEARTMQESYPVGTDEVELEITNHGESPLSYTGYYDFRMLENGEWQPLSPRSDVLFDSTEHLLKPGETVTQTVPIDLFEAPLKAGTYRISQLACFSTPDGGFTACSEITASLTIK
ncbi:immunoglobulin-like domain-containing protein [Oscillospiraceae bacterium PP1C4]